MKKEEENPDLKDMCASYLFTFNPKNEFINRHKNDLFQQFFVISLDYDDLKKLYDYEGSSMKEFIQKENIRPKVVSKYPPYDLDYLQISDQVVASHCCPNFYQMIPETNELPSKTEEKFHFSLDNFDSVYIKAEENKKYPERLLKKYKEIYHKVYYDCYLFYEPLTSYDIYFNKECNENKKNIFVCKILCLSSFLPFQREKVSMLKKIRRMSQFEGLTVPIEKVVERIINDIPSIPKGFHFLYDFFKLKSIQYEFIRFPPNKLPKCSLDMEKLVSYFTPENAMKVFKAILLEVPVLLFNSNKEILSTLVEIFINLLYPFEYKNTIVHILPKDNYTLIGKLNTFIIGIGETYQEGFLERNNIEVYNKHMILIDLKANKGTRLIPYVSNINQPVLNLNCNKDRNRPLEPTVAENYFETIDMPVHYKNKSLDKLKKEFEAFDRMNSKNRKFSLRRMQTISIEKLAEDDDSKSYDVVSEPNTLNSNIQAIFYYFFVCIFMEMRNYFEVEEQAIEVNKAAPYKKFKNLKSPFYLEDVFNIKKFIKDLPLLDVPFYERFCNTAMFHEFIIKNRFPVSYDHIDRTLLFLESVLKKINKKAFTKKTKVFFSENDFTLKDIFDANDKKKVIQYDSDVFEISPEEVEALQEFKQQNSEEYQKLFQKYSFMKDVKDPSRDKMTHSYTVFPRFITNELISPIYGQENNFINIRNSIDSENKTEVVKKIKKYENIYYDFYDSVRENISAYYYLDKEEILNSISFTTLIKILWLKLFIKRFKNVRQSDKKEVFNQMMHVIKRSTWVPEDVFSELFFCIYKYGDYDQLITLFNYIQPNQYKFNVLMADKLRKEKKKIEVKKDTEAEINNNPETPKNKTKAEFTFNFLDIIYCPECSNEINLKDSHDPNKKNSKYFCDKCNINYFGNSLLVINKGENKQTMRITFQIWPIVDLIKSLETDDDFYDLYLISLPKSKVFSSIFYFSYCGLPSKFLVKERDILTLTDLSVSNEILLNFKQEKKIIKKEEFKKEENKEEEDEQLNILKRILRKILKRIKKKKNQKKILRKI
ncbi:MAG: hypothetical protein MJ252_12365 [archaeon]|nr:hypothetical protein [archaeon]